MTRAEIIGRNLTHLRKARGLTQGQIAQKFNYSDKSISKWEHGEMVPDIETLIALADFYGVTLDYLVQDQTAESLEEKGKYDYRDIRNNRIIIALLAILSVWTIATIIYAAALIFETEWTNYMIFVWALPLSLLVLRFYVKRYFKNIVKPWFTLTLNIALLWTFLIALYLEFNFDIEGGWNLWFILLAGLPVTLIMLYAYFSNRIKWMTGNRRKNLEEKANEPGDSSQT